MSFTQNYGSIPSLPEEPDTSECGCDFECGTVGYCLKKCGANYIISKLLSDKGYKQPNLDWGRIGISEDEGKTIYTTVPGIEMYRRQVQKFIANMKQLGYDCSTYTHPLGKRYLQTVIIENGIDPITIAYEFLKLDVVS